MRKLLILVGCSILSACASTKNDVNSPVSHSPIASIKNNFYVDLSASERCKLKEEPSVKDGKLSLKPILNKDGEWLCETKPVVYTITLAVKNTDSVIKNFELECNNPYGLMKDCKGWGAWQNEMGPGPYIIESKGSPEVKTKNFNAETNK